MQSWPEDFLRVIDGAAAVSIATHDANLRPRSTRGAVVRVGDAPGELVIYVTTLFAERVLPQLRDHGAIAVSVSLTLSHEAYQVKGRVRAIADAAPADEARLAARHALMIQTGAGLGLPRRLLERVQLWPALAITMTAEQLFHQTPGPGAGRAVAT